MPKAYLGLGSNLGIRKENIDSAISLIKNHQQVNITKISSYYETEPIGYKEQNWFLNIVIEIDTSLQPYELLEFCGVIEEKLMRKREVKWGPRTIDVDILLYEGFTSQDERLTLPHPQMTKRAFVMVPLQEIVEDIAIEDKNIDQIVKDLTGQKLKKL